MSFCGFCAKDEMRNLEKEILAWMSSVAFTQIQAGSSES